MLLRKVVPEGREDKGPLGPTEAEDFPSTSEISLGWLLRWAALVQKDGGRENCFSELPVQKNTESVFIAKFQKDSIKRKPQKHKDKCLLCSAAYPTYITSEDRALAHYIKYLVTAEFFIILTLALVYPLKEYFHSAENVNAAPCNFWSSGFSSSRSSSKVGNVTSRNGCYQQGPKWSWWR